MFAAVRAYAIRPYTCLIEILCMLGVGSVFALFRAYAIRPYTCSIEILGMVGG